jgi:hypothetical protein
VVALGEVGVLGDDLRHGRHAATLRLCPIPSVVSAAVAESSPVHQEAHMAKSARKRRARRKKSANHGKRPNA